MAKKYKQRADGRYSTQVSTGRYTDNGKPIRITLYASSSRELERLVSEKKYEISQGILSKNGNVLFGRYAEEWFSINKASKAPSTRSMYNTMISRHLGPLAGMKIRDITRFDVQKQINTLAQYPRTCNQLRMTIHQILEAAVDDGLIGRNVCTKIELPTYKAKEKRALSDQEKKSIRTADFTFKERAYVYLLYGCGLRPEEVRALRKEDFNFDTNEVSINKVIAFDGNKALLAERTKTFAGIRTLPLPDVTAKAVLDYLEILEDTDFLFALDNDGGFKTKAAYYADWIRIVKKINKGNKGEQLTEYIFRHNYCTELYYAGISIKECVRLMGHSNYSMIMKVYAHLDAKKEQSASKIREIF